MEGDSKLSKGNQVLCIGSANMDYKMNLKGEFIKGTSNPVTSSVSYGGVIRNVAENLGRLGAQVALMSILGEDIQGNNLIAHASHCMDTSAVEKTAAYGTGNYSALLDINGEMIIGMADMEINRLMDRAWIVRHREDILRSQWIAVDCNIEKDAMEALIQLAVETGKNLAIIGVSGPKMDRIPEVIDGVAIGIFNRDETQSYFKTDEDDVEKLCGMWLNKGLKQAVVTSGKHAIGWGDDSGIHSTKVRVVDQVVDVTGAGDAFCAGLIFGLTEAKPLQECINLGMANSTLTIQSKESVQTDLTYEKLLKEIAKQKDSTKELNQRT